MASVSLSNFEKICEFHKEFGLPVSNGVNQMFLHDFKTVSLRVKLIQEEFDELCNSKTIIDELDAIGDLLYVVYGAGACFGFDMDKEFDEYYQKHLESQRKPYDHNSIFLTNFQKTCIICPQCNVKNIIEQLLEHRPITPKSVCCCDLINFDALIKQFATSILLCDANKVKTILVKMLSSLSIVGFVCKYDIDKLFSVIHISNMSKLCITEREAIDTIVWYVKNQSERYTQPKYTHMPNGSMCVVFDDATGKRLKSIHYSPPNIIEHELMMC